MRVYIPAKASQLSEIASGQWDPGDAFAVTESMLELAPQLDPDEVAEEVIHVAAMQAALELGSPLRVVVVADLPRADVRPNPEAHPAAVLLGDVIPRDAIACAFVDEPEAESDIAGALAGDESASDRLGERDLLWYDVSELASIALA
ncbi:DUF6912 family protein [Demequina sp. NBRC 110054]|uniref:DUF6912 family protein n=1 Tax=Demequina sp. NBRC 110054 TaxID=1570343 RepID=UPI000A072756|nr:hypothetical protein [Demequina sp. NBRC 110054]